MAILNDLLRDNCARFAPDYQRALTNHLPMCLVALQQLGATDVRLAEFQKTYLKRLEPSRTDARALELENEIKVQGRDAVLLERLTALAPQLAGAAFHGLIRTAYGTICQDAHELAFGLSYFEKCAFHLVECTASGEEVSVERLASQLARQGLPRPGGHTIAARLQRVAGDDRFLAIVKRLAIDETTLDQVSALGARAYLAADDFTSLHVLTASHALRRLRPWTRDARQADFGLAVAALACYVVSGCPLLDALELPMLSWDEIRRLAVLSDDDHVCKLVFSCSEEETATGASLYRMVATQVAQRGTS